MVELRLRLLRFGIELFERDLWRCIGVPVYRLSTLLEPKYLLSLT